MREPSRSRLASSGDAARRRARGKPSPRLALQLSPGSVLLSIRAIARDDGNTISGPGTGTSDTRTFRVAQRDEYDSVAIESAAPNVADSSSLSERVVIIGTTELIARMARRPPITHDSMTAASQRLADQQDAVRNAITAVMSADDENELPMADVLSAPERALLDSASYAMGEASARLAARTPRSALPAERRALAMVDSARSLARRVYLRSRPPRLLVDVAHVRLSGTEHPDPAARSPGRPDTADALWLARVGHVARVLAGPGQRGTEAYAEARRAAIDSLVVLRVAVLGSHPMLAAALTGGDRHVDARRRQPTASARPRAHRSIADPVDDMGGPACGSEWSMSAFVFATGRYQSGDWDAAPLVPANLIDSVARYTSIDIAPAGIVVALDSPALFEYPLVYLTGHLPMRFTDEERRQVQRYLDRGGDALRR